MRQHILYALSEESASPETADELVERFSHFVADRNWVSGAAHAVDQRGEADDDAWELGLSLELPDPGQEPAGWLEDVERIAVFLRELAEEFDLEFVVGIADQQRGFSEDLFSVDSGPIDIEQLQALIGIAPP